MQLVLRFIVNLSVSVTDLSVYSYGTCNTNTAFNSVNIYKHTTFVRFIVVLQENVTTLRKCAIYVNARSLLTVFLMCLPKDPRLDSFGRHHTLQKVCRRDAQTSTL